MTAFLVTFATFLLLTLAGGLLRIISGPRAADRMLAAQLFGTTGAAILLVLSAAVEAPALRNVALVFAVLAAVNALVFARGARDRRRGSAP